MRRIFLFGYYGFNNIGDEAILEAIVRQLRLEMPDIDITALSYNASFTSSQYGIRAVSRNRFLDVFRCIRRSDLVMSGGGSIVQDVTSSRSLFYYLGIIILAKMLGKKVACYGNGFGPVKRPINRLFVKWVMAHVDLITVRDSESLELLQKIGIRQPIHITADAAFSLLPLFDEGMASPKKSEKCVGISVRDWNGRERYSKMIASCADQMVEQGYTVCFFPMQHPSDTQVSNEIIGLMHHPAEMIERAGTPNEVIRSIADMDFMIGMRLHSLIFASIAGVPCLGVSYESKVSHFLRQVNQPETEPIPALTRENLWEAISRLLDHREEHRRELMEKREELYEKAADTARIICDFLMEENTIENGGNDECTDSPSDHGRNQQTVKRNDGKTRAAMHYDTKPGNGHDGTRG